MHGMAWHGAHTVCILQIKHINQFNSIQFKGIQSTASPTRSELHENNSMSDIGLQKDGRESQR